MPRLPRGRAEKGLMHDAFGEQGPIRMVETKLAPGVVWGLDREPIFQDPKQLAPLVIIHPIPGGRFFRCHGVPPRTIPQMPTMLHGEKFPEFP